MRTTLWNLARCVLLVAVVSMAQSPCCLSQAAVAWGGNVNGQLGDGTNTNRSAPVQVRDPGDPTGFLQNAAAISCYGFHSVALRTDGTVWTWGLNNYGQLGDGTSTDRNTPVQVIDPTDPTGFLQNVVSVATGGYHTLVVKADGTVWAWGNNNFGQLGNGTTVNSRVPVRVLDSADPSGFLQNVSGVAGGDAQTVAVKTDGTVWTWGANSYGQLGDGTTTGRSTPVQVKDLNDPSGYLQNAVYVQGGAYQALALLADGTVRGWGRNDEGELGDGTFMSRTSAVQTIDPTDPSGFLQNVSVLSGGASHGVVLKGDGTVWAWGHNGLGQLGDGTTTFRNSPVQVKDPGDPSGFIQGVANLNVAGAGYHSLAIKADGTAWAWGDNDHGQLGDGTTANRPTPVQVTNPSDPTGFLQGVTALAEGVYHNLGTVTP